MQSQVKKQNQSGFTLVELAIVMVIVGLLITGVLKGQELVNNARVNSTVNQCKSLDAAIATFKDIYRALPGDMSDATTRIPNCSNGCDDGDGNSRIDGAGAGAAEVITVPTATDETIFAFGALNAADLISGVDGTVTAQFGKGLIESSIGGGFWIGYDSDGAETGFAAHRTGHYLAINGETTTIAAGTGGLSPSQGARIDRKLDDGLPNAGLVRGVFGAAGTTGCADGNTATDNYQENIEVARCAVIIRLQN